jgi:hypothetical protein
MPGFNILFSYIILGDDENAKAGWMMFIDLE